MNPLPISTPAIGHSSILQGKHAVVFGGGGSIGAAVAKEFAAEGAIVSLAGRNFPRVEAVANQIRKSGGRASAHALDALDDAAVNQYFDRIVKEIGPVDAMFNAVGPRVGEYGVGKLAVDLPIEEFMVPLGTAVKSSFITARAAARQMIERRSGVIILVTGSPARGHVEGGASIGTAFGAIETLAENLAFELGRSGIRVVCLRTTINCDSRTMGDVIEGVAATGVAKEAMIAKMADLNFLKLPASTSDTAQTAAFLASDRARMITGTVVNASAGAALD